MLPLRVIAALIALTSPAAARPVQVVSVVGTATADGAPLGHGAILQDGAVVELRGRSDALQLLLGHRLAIGLCRRARVRIAGEDGDLTLIHGAVRLSGRGTAVVGRLRVDLTRGEALLQGGRVHLLSGQATLRTASGKRRLAPGQGTRLDEMGRPVRARRPVDPRLLQRCRSYAAPPSWQPEAGELDLDRAVRSVRQRVEAQREREREMASCGCTESSGPGAQIDRTKGTQSRPEGRPARVHVRVRGVPRSP